MTPDEIAVRMDGKCTYKDGKRTAILPSPAVQNHAAFLARGADGALVCAWFGGSLEGRSDINIYASVLSEESATWSPPSRLTDLSDRSEQNPVLFTAPSGEIFLFNTAQPAGNQDEARVYMRKVDHVGDQVLPGPPRDIGLPPGTFIRAPLQVRDDGAWMLPLFLCNPREGIRWTGAHDSAAIAVSRDEGASWSVTHVPESLGSVHMTPVELADGRMVAFYRRRQADWVHRSESTDGGRTWSPPHPTDVPNNNSSIGVIRLGDGALAMVCNPVSADHTTSRRASLYDELGDPDDGRQEAQDGCQPIWGVERAPLALCFSDDGGRSFPVRHVIESSPGTCLSNDSLDGRNKELSYPMLLQRPDGGLDIVYTLYRRAIRHVQLAAEDLARMQQGANREGVRT